MSAQSTHHPFGTGAEHGDEERRRALRVSWRRHPLLMLRPRRRRMAGVEHLQVTTSRSEILRRVQEMPVSLWSYGWEDDVQHLGPMAQDFYHRFGLGDSDRHINIVDSAGVLFACVQALAERVEVLEAELALRPPAAAS